MWLFEDRPGFFGKNRDNIIAGYNEKYGKDGWQLAWMPSKYLHRAYVPYDFINACKAFYEQSYYIYMRSLPFEILDELCRYGECYDNAITNVKSRLDYTIQEAYSTHIQDIAVRNVMAALGRKFMTGGAPLLQIRGSKVSIGGTCSLGTLLSPANVPFYDPDMIIQPSKCPDWANEGSVEDFWQSNKILQVWKDNPMEKFLK